MIQAGNLGPVLKRWINTDVAPIAEVLREVARAYLKDDLAQVAKLLDMPVADLGVGKERPLRPLMEWCLRGSSPGRVAGDGETSFADDLVLAFMATALSVVAQAHTSRRAEGRANEGISHAGVASAKPKKGPTFSSVMASSSDAIRQTVLGQFITGIQGAGAMQAIRERKPEIWKQKKSLSRICSLLTSQAKPLLKEMELAGVESVLSGHKTVLKVMGSSGDERMLTVVPPDAIAWEVMSLCWSDARSAATSEYRSLWLGFTGLILAAAQRVGGWFEVGGSRVGRKGHTRTTKYLLLSAKAAAAIKADGERWLAQGFDPEPMIVPPEDGDYLTVKHRKVTGQRPPRGLLTKAGGTTAWNYGATALANTPWTVNVAALDAATEAAGEDANLLMRVAAHRRLAVEEAFYLPTCMDFRGRVYYRTPWVSPQSGDLGKSLLAFPPNGDKLLDGYDRQAVVMHLAGLYAGPDKLDKAPWLKREAWWKDGWAGETEGADKPLTLAAHWQLIETNEWDRIPIQLDGTCNGLQHLSAMFRDEEAARHVNLTRSTLEDAPADIYGVVASEVSKRLASRLDHWAIRLEVAKVLINRKLTKGPVMVLPYGGTREAVRLSVKAAVLDQLGDLQYGTNSGGASASPWHRMTELGYGKKDQAGYEPFAARDLYDHPGFNADVGQLANLVWESITPAIPRAMAAMQALVQVAGFVGDRGLSWRVGLGPEDKRLWVTQAKSKSSRKQVTMRGFHLPDMVRRLTLMAHTDEVDERGHRTGIVANLIHALDAAHLAATVQRFRVRGGGCVGSVHDCLMVRPSEAKLMGECLRDTFVEMYEDDPLGQPVRLLTGDEAGSYTEFDSWYSLASEAGVEFPERGSFDIQEVRESAWFFS